MHPDCLRTMQVWSSSHRPAAILEVLGTGLPALHQAMEGNVPS